MPNPTPPLNILLESLQQMADIPLEQATGLPWDWTPYYIATTKAVMDGTWETEAHYGNMADGMVDIAPYGASVDEVTRALIDERKAEIINGSFSIFPESVVDQDGNTRPLGDIFTMDYFVQGVVGSPTG